MTKTFTRANPLFFRLRSAFARRPHGPLLSLGLLLTSACGDDFSSPTVSNTANDDESSAPFSTPGQTNDGPTTSPTTKPLPAETSDELAHPPNGKPDGAVGVSDAGPQGPKPMPSMDGPSSDDMAGGECGGEGQACCGGGDCRRGFTCTASDLTDIDTGDSGLTCKRDPEVPPGPEGDAAPPVPGIPPGPEGDGGPPPGPGMPPAPEGDGGSPPDMPAPDEDCGSQGEQCCKGPGGRCDEGLSCENPDGPGLEDSECVPEE